MSVNQLPMIHAIIMYFIHVLIKKFLTHLDVLIKMQISWLLFPLNQFLSQQSQDMYFNVKHRKPAEKVTKAISRILLPALFPSLPVCLQALQVLLLPLVHRAKNVVQLEVIMITIITQIANSTRHGAAQGIDGRIQGSHVSKPQDLCRIQEMPGLAFILCSL